MNEILENLGKIGETVKQAVNNHDKISTVETKEQLKTTLQQSIHTLLQIAEDKGISFFECIYNTTNSLDEALNPGMFIFTSKSDKNRYYAEHHITLEWWKIPKAMKEKLQEFKEKYGKVPEDLVWSFQPYSWNKYIKRKQLTEKDFE